MNTRSKKERILPSIDRNQSSSSLSLTLSSIINVGETFIVLRRAPNSHGITDQRCLATVIEIREDARQLTKEDAPGYMWYQNDSDVLFVCNDLINRVVGDNSFLQYEDIIREHRKMYYVHYDGMDRRLDEWVERSRIIERIYSSKLAPSTGPSALLSTSLEIGTLTRSQRRIHEEFNHVQRSYEDMDATTAKLEKEHAEMTKVKHIEKICFGDYEIDAWYVSPYPDEYRKSSMLYICEYCLGYMRSDKEYSCHLLHYCDRRQPPGIEVYKEGSLSLFEVDGKGNKVYCQCLCLLSKLFLDHKTLFFDVETFLFYILCEVDDMGAHVVGHFSKELFSSNNLACIMVLPPFQRKGYGKLLIQISYELSHREGVIGTPEKPLSDLGKVSYRSYWWWVLLETLDRLSMDDVTVSDLALASGIAEDDIISTLQTMQLIKYWKGDHVVRMTRRLVEHCKMINVGRPPKLTLNADNLKWWPKNRPTV